MILRAGVYAVDLTREQSRQLRQSSNLQIWSRVEQGERVQVVFRLERAAEWTFRALPLATRGVHEQLDTLTTSAAEH